MITLDPNAPSTAALAAKLPWLAPALSKDWIQNAGPDLTPVAEGIGVKMVKYETQESDKGRYESHRHHADIQVCLEGSELIDVTPTDSLEPSTEWDAEEDLTFYHPPIASPTTISFTQGKLLVLYPEDAHRCATRDGVNSQVRKLVFKVHSSLWNQS
ncbi:MAG: YhcH/YjgK/YiaL family protein [Verrucomicrobiota bacterium]